MRLCLFTNCTNDILTRPTIIETYKSWVKSFGEPEDITIYCDPNPNPQYLDKYLVLLKQHFTCDIVITKGLADGYRKALDGKDDYLFMCEADWTFSGIEHGLNDIIETMEQDNLWFMLFNKHSNVDNPKLAKWQSYLRPSDNNMYCLTDRVSNNPHIINREYYLKNVAPLVDWTIGGAGRIEQVLEKKFEVAVYGEYNYEPTIHHQDARRGGKK